MDCPQLAPALLLAAGWTSGCPDETDASSRRIWRHARRVPGTMALFNQTDRCLPDMRPRFSTA